jgi:hypothetical protein
MSFKYTGLFQHFPRICSIFGYGVAEAYGHLEDISIGFPISADMSSSITHLELKKSFTSHLCTILKIPKALITFIYEKGGGHSPLQATVTDVLHALTPQFDSLENLWLDCKDPDDRWYESEDVINEVALLSNFTRLKNLRIGGIVLYMFLEENNWDPSQRSSSGLLPESLETLHIIEFPRPIIWKCCRDFVLAELNHVNRLRKIFIEGLPRTSVQLKALQGQAKNQGVDVISLTRNNDFYFERGWGMDGSIQWGRCVPVSNIDVMPLLSENKEEGDTGNKPGSLKVSNSKFFYKWPLGRTDDYDSAEDAYNTDSESTDDEEMDDQDLNERETDVEDSDEVATDEEQIDTQEAEDQMKADLGTEKEEYGDEADKGDGYEEKTKDMGLDGEKSSVQK